MHLRKNGKYFSFNGLFLYNKISFFFYRKDFYRDVRILAALEDPNIARVLGICSDEEPLCVVMEYLDHGDLCQFLKTHVAADDNATLPYGVKSLSFNCLLYMGAQIASGMRYLESLNFVHRDIATRYLNKQYCSHI